MKYLHIINPSEFGFKDNDIHKILDSDIQISNEVYNKFFKEQSEGKQFKIKNKNGTTFEDIFEEIIPEFIKENPENTVEERLSAIEVALAEQLGG